MPKPGVKHDEGVGPVDVGRLVGIQRCEGAERVQETWQQRQAAKSTVIFFLGQNGKRRSLHKAGPATTSKRLWRPGSSRVQKVCRICIYFAEAKKQPWHFLITDMPPLYTSANTSLESTDGGSEKPTGCEIYGQSNGFRHIPARRHPQQLGKSKNEQRNHAKHMSAGS